MSLRGSSARRISHGAKDAVRARSRPETPAEAAPASPHHDHRERSPRPTSTQSTLDRAHTRSQPTQPQVHAHAAVSVESVGRPPPRTTTLIRRRLRRLSHRPGPAEGEPRSSDRSPAEAEAESRPEPSALFTTPPAPNPTPMHIKRERHRINPKPTPEPRPDDDDDPPQPSAPSDPSPNQTHRSHASPTAVPDLPFDLVLRLTRHPPLPALPGPSRDDLLLRCQDPQPHHRRPVAPPRRTPPITAHPTHPHHRRQHTPRTPNDARLHEQRAAHNHDHDDHPADRPFPRISNTAPSAPPKTSRDNNANNASTRVHPAQPRPSWPPPPFSPIFANNPHHTPQPHPHPSSIDRSPRTLAKRSTSRSVPPSSAQYDQTYSSSPTPPPRAAATRRTVPSERAMCGTTSAAGPHKPAAFAASLGPAPASIAQDATCNFRARSKQLKKSAQDHDEKHPATPPRCSSARLASPSRSERWIDQKSSSRESPTIARTSSTVIRAAGLTTPGPAGEHPPTPPVSQAQNRSASSVPTCSISNAAAFGSIWAR